MHLPELERFLEQENERLLESLPGLSPENMALAQTVKLSEEVGELGADVLSSHGLQRPRADGDRSELAMEVADVLITGMLLGETLDIDIETAMAAKMESIENRYE